MAELSLCTKESFDEVMRKYADMVYRLAYSRVGNSTDADDVFQEVFLRYIKADKTYNDEEHRKAWLIKITLNCSKSFLTSAWNRHRDFEEPDENEGMDDENIKNTEIKSDVLNALLKLDTKYRTAIYLHYYEGYSVKELSKILKISESNVKVRLKRGRDKLKELISEKGE